VAYRAIHSYPPLGLSYADAVKQAGQFIPANKVPGLPEAIAWAPKNLPRFNPADYDARKFAKDQFIRWASPEMKRDIEYGRAKLSKALSTDLPKLPGMSETEIATWTAGYLQSRGLPKNLEDGAHMGTAFAHAEAEALGVQPEWIAAADALMNPSAIIKDPSKMVEEVGKAYIMKYGVPLLQQELMSVSSNLAMVTQGIPVQFAVAGFDALKDGKLSKQEIAAIAVQAASYACGLLLQAVGIPAPLGALIGAMIATGLGKVASDVIYSEDADQRARKAAIAAAEKLRGQLMAQCAAAAPDAWNKAQDYWDKVLAPIQALMDQPDVQKRLIAAGGIRYYGRNTVTLPPGITLPNAWPRDQWQAGGIVEAAASAEAAAKVAEAAASQKLAGPQAKAQAQAARLKANTLAVQAAADANKPLYEYGFDCLWWEGKLVSGFPASARPFPDGCPYFTTVVPKGYPPTGQNFDPSTWQVWPYWPNPALIGARCAAASGDPQRFHASFEDKARCAPAEAAMTYWQNSPEGKGQYTMSVRLTPYSDHTSVVRTKTVTIGQGAMVDGKPNAQAALMFWGATRPATIWSQLHLKDATEDATDAGRWKAFAYIDPSLTYSKSSAHLDVPQNYCDVSQWYVAVQTAAAASALVQQDIIRTVAWQVGAEEAQRQAAIAKQTAGAALIAQQAARALLQAKAAAMARAATGAYSAALKARLAYQAKQAAAALTRKVLTVAGVAVGAFVIWKVVSERRARGRVPKS